MIAIKCPVCSEELIKVDNAYKCRNKHCFDIAKSGYTNLLLANEHGVNSGDDKEMVLARKEFFRLDKYHCLKAALLQIIKEYTNKDIKFLDIACGEGYYTNYLHKELAYKGILTYGIDISKFAVIEASKKKKEEKLTNIEYFSANLSKLPFFDNSFNLLLNCFAPFDAKEFYRVLDNEGFYLRVLPGKRHLWGLKEILYTHPYLNKKKDEEIEGMKLIKEVEVNDLIELKNNEEIMNLFKMTPYYYKTSFEDKEKLKRLESFNSEISFEIRIYQKIVKN